METVLFVLLIMFLLGDAGRGWGYSRWPNDWRFLVASSTTSAQLRKVPLHIRTEDYQWQQHLSAVSKDQG